MRTFFSYGVVIKIPVFQSFLILFMLNAFPVEAAMDFEAERAQSVEKTKYLAVELEFAGKAGNTDKQQYGASGFTSRRVEQDHYMLYLSKEYGSSQKEKDTNKGNAHLRWTRYQDEHWSNEVFLQAEHDEFKDLDLRWLLGAGRRWEKDKDALGIGLTYERDKFSTPDTPAKSTWRLNGYWHYHTMINDHVLFNNSFAAQPRIDDLGDFRAFNETSIESKLTDRLNLKSSVTIAYDSRPAADVERRDITYALGFRYAY
ncbi:DUF481 domain-containing protein [Algicola sagamiensis]|uniref:DUF481 domain-containing protein n=1 Tax=Algicola sagamiensis TaxID=163869 RepID=UPI000363ADBF|nr:DUF481 domain-containing protein [Algicola sagamiensis]